MNQTGPRTPEGKAIASRNAIKHGLRAMTMVIPGLEEEGDWHTFHTGVVAYYQPDGAVPYALVDRAAGLLWRLRRVARAEQEAALEPPEDKNRRYLEPWAIESLKQVAAQFRPPDDDDDPTMPPVEPSPPPPPPEPRILPGPVKLLTLSKYESRLNAQLLRVLREIERCKEARQEKPIPFHAL